MLFCVYTLYPSDCLLAWDYTFVGNDEYLTDLAIGSYKNAIHGIHLKYADCLAKLNLTVLPTSARTVTAAVNVGIGKIILAPATPTVAATKKHVPPSSVDLGAIEEVPNFRVYASPKVQMRESGDLQPSENQRTVAPCPEFLAPFWLVKTTLIAGDANMELVQVEHGNLIIPCLKIQRPSRRARHCSSTAARRGLPTWIPSTWCARVLRGPRRLEHGRARACSRVRCASLLASAI